MNKKISILVACGSGIATSTIAADSVKEVCKEFGIDLYTISKCSMTELPSRAEEADIILTTNNYKGDLGKPVMSIIGFISGINEEQLKEKLGTTLLNLTNQEE